ncbi:MAG: group III truncated hemoglobin [Alphaproteobacteria bacterium]
MNEPGVDKTGITRADIRSLIEPFYRRVRADTQLGPIFHGKIGVDDDVWARHLDKIEDFWANVMLHDRAYKGNPLTIHAGIPAIQPEHFEIWLNHFEQTARAVLPAQKAETFNTLARRIGRSLSMGIEIVRKNNANA